MVSLRPYQVDCISRIKSAINSGKRRIYATLATGSGKTVIFSALTKQLGAKRTLVLAHREELLKQAQEKLINAGLTAELEQANNRASDNCQVVVASVQTLNSSERIYKFKHDEFDLIIIDENHHGVCKSYVNILDYFSKAIVVGFTATPHRADDIDLREVFTDGLVYSLSREELTRQGFLVPIQKMTYTVPSLNARHVFEAYQALASNQKTLVFCQDIEHSIEVSQYFNSNGVKSSYIHGKIDKEQRAETLRQFKHNGVKVLANVNVLTEGYDEPSIECVILARNTNSPVLFNQILGRGVRLFAGKSHLKVIELAIAPEIRPMPARQRPTAQDWPSREQQPERVNVLWTFLVLAILAGLIFGLITTVQYCNQEISTLNHNSSIIKELRSEYTKNDKQKRVKQGKRIKQRKHTHNRKPKFHVKRSSKASF